MADGGSDLQRLWTLDRSVVYLNHGSFGACPKVVQEYQSALRERMEREPVDFLDRELPDRLALCRETVGAFVGAEPEGLAFVPNATTAINAALRSLPMADGDEILTTDHAYGACRKAMEFLARRRGARVVAAPVPFPLGGPDDVVEAVLSAVSPRTRVAVLDHVTSPTALVFPVERLVAELRGRGIETIVDGAHALGMLPLRLDEWGAACYAANAHKWLCAPKGAAILHVRADLRLRVRPLVVSHGYDPSTGDVRFRAEWDWLGTSDPTPWLSIPECIRFLGGVVEGGWPALRLRNHALALRARKILCDAFEVEAPCPESMIGSMASVPLPRAAEGAPAAGLDREGLGRYVREHGIESWFSARPSGMLVRASAQAYNAEGQYERLAEVLLEALGRKGT